MSATRVSPFHGALAVRDAHWAERDGMRVARQLRDDDSARASVLGLVDLSYLARTGFKGPGAAALLHSLGHELPPPNGWKPGASGGLIARLATSEFFVEDLNGNATVAAIDRALARPPADVCPVPRQDAALALTGSRVNELLVQTCNVNFQEVGSGAVVLTMMVGVAVQVISQTIGGIACQRIWCDPSFAPYLWNTLAEIAEELGGGPVGTQVLVD
jgi:sarcosine oxidase subunit gamma